MNIQLYVEGQLCDFDNNTYVTLQKEFSDETELIVKEIEYSYTLSIPTSLRNKRIFGFIDDFDVANKFTRVYNAELYVGEMLILRGKLRLTEIDSEYFKGNLYNPASKSISDILGDRQLNEIIPHMKPMNSLSDYRQCNNFVMGINTVDIPTYQYRDRHICYPYVLYSLPMNDADKAIDNMLDFYTQDLRYGNHRISTDNIYPSFNVLSVLKDMFATEGYNLTGNIFGDDKFKDLYQTFQYDYSKWKEERNSPFYLKFNCEYTNLKIKGQNNYNIPSTLQLATMWEENEYEEGDGHFGANFYGKFEAGVDAPLVTDTDNVKINILKNDQHMMKKGETTNGYTIVVPRSGWYRIHCDGKLKYPIERSTKNMWAILVGLENIYRQENRESIGGVLDEERDNTSLEMHPFEFQIKKGYPMESSQMYSFNGTLPIMPNHYAQFDTVRDYANDYEWAMYIKCGTAEKHSLYGKNGRSTIVKEYSDKNISDFIAGARLGGSYFSTFFHREYDGPERSQNRLALMGALMALPRADKKLEFRTWDDGTKCFKINTGIDGVPYNDQWEYAKNTAQVLVRDDSFSEFPGYNKVNFVTGTWDTTTNYNSRTYLFEDQTDAKTKNTASTSDKQNGQWNINTVVWLEEGENINFEVIMPLHFGGHYTCCHSEWENSENWINATNVSFNYEMGYINSDKKWYPNVITPIPSFDNLSEGRETNVNSFLPTVKCNDYLNNFLQTFNLQLTMVNKTTFSIDYAKMNDVNTEVISIDRLANIKDAEFKTFDLPATRQLSWKIDKNETGYYHGNQSPYNAEVEPWDESGYTGEIVITNEANTSGSISKKESSWSYNWYKDIKFLGGLGMSITGAPISVISAKENWSDEYTYFSAEGDTPKTSSTMRFFFLSKNPDTSLYNYIEFKYDERSRSNSTNEDLLCRLVIPSNSVVTKQSSGNRMYLLDYNSKVSANIQKRVKTITDIFFNLYVQTGYQLNVPIKLPNGVYSKINAGTLIKFNDGLYKVKQIEGHDVTEQEDATLSLLTLK